MEGSRDYILDLISREKMLSFEKIFDVCDNKIHAIFLFLSILELAQQKYMRLSVGPGMNNFIVEWNENREEDLVAETTMSNDGDATAEDTSTDLQAQ
jgi:segregation and condensation protein A